MTFMFDNVIPPYLFETYKYLKPLYNFYVSKVIKSHTPCKRLAVSELTVFFVGGVYGTNSNYLLLKFYQVVRLDCSGVVGKCLENKKSFP